MRATIRKTAIVRGHSHKRCESQSTSQQSSCRLFLGLGLVPPYSYPVNVVYLSGSTYPVCPVFYLVLSGLSYPVA
ncbi:hypothetical protein [Leptolyngbya sp. ST-U4]|uniref:hypothetical protein n=1 Tax=Leptolyngbya sp. ST-U4 TaxID=2933912 RepID=UPI003299DAC8